MKVMRKIILPAAFAAVVLMAGSCTGCQERKAEVAVDSMLVVKDTVTVTQKDSTVWGHLGEDTSMNVCQFVTDEGDTIFLLRHAENGEFSQILGSTEVDRDRYAVTIGTDGEEPYIRILVNTTQLMGVWKNKEDELALYADGHAEGRLTKYTKWQMMNGRLVLSGKTSTEYGETDRIDTMTLTWLDRDSLKFITPQHVEMAYGR